MYFHPLGTRACTRDLKAHTKLDSVSRHFDLEREPVRKTPGKLRKDDQSCKGVQDYLAEKYLCVRERRGKYDPKQIVRNFLSVVETKTAPSLRRLISTVPAFLFIHETEDAGEFVEGQVARFPFSLAILVLRVPEGQKRKALDCFEVLFARRALQGCLRQHLRKSQVWKRIHAVHQMPPFGTKKHNSIPLFLLINSTGT